MWEGLWIVDLCARGEGVGVEWLLQSYVTSLGWSVSKYVSECTIYSPEVALFIRHTFHELPRQWPAQPASATGASAGTDTD